MKFFRSRKAASLRRDAADLSRDLQVSQRDLGLAKTMVEQVKRAADECLALPEAQLQHVQAEFCRQIVEFEDILLAAWKSAEHLRAKAMELDLTVEPRKARLTIN
jgi:hypothetical protein